MRQWKWGSSLLPASIFSKKQQARSSAEREKGSGEPIFEDRKQTEIYPDKYWEVPVSPEIMIKIPAEPGTGREFIDCGM